MRNLREEEKLLLQLREMPEARRDRGGGGLLTKQERMTPAISRSRRDDSVTCRAEKLFFESLCPQPLKRGVEEKKSTVKSQYNESQYNNTSQYKDSFAAYQFFM